MYTHLHRISASLLTIRNLRCKQYVYLQPSGQEI
jgi:hypothetical protein